MSEVSVPCVRRVVLRNYRSVKQCDVSLEPLTFLVGPNGSGKSNFLDALRFVAGSLRGPMDEEVWARGTLEYLGHRSPEPAKSFFIQLELTLAGGGDARYRFDVASKPGGFAIAQEDCVVRGETTPEASYSVRDGQVQSATIQPAPPAPSDRLYLANVSGFPQFRPVYDHLIGMKFYNILPEAIKQHAVHGSSDILLPDGTGAANILREIYRRSPGGRERINEYMQAILPGLESIEVETLERHTTVRRIGPAGKIKTRFLGDDDLALWFAIRSGDASISYPHQSMSDGTLHAFGVLLALFQCCDRPPNRPISLVGIEEPEAALHPAAAGILRDALIEGSQCAQVIVTSHSAELLDSKDFNQRWLLVVDNVDGKTVIGPADEASRSIMRDRLYTAGELLKLNQLQPQVE